MCVSLCVWRYLTIVLSSIVVINKVFFVKTLKRLEIDANQKLREVFTNDVTAFPPFKSSCHELSSWKSSILELEIQMKSFENFL